MTNRDKNKDKNSLWNKSYITKKGVVCQEKITRCKGVLLIHSGVDPAINLVKEGVLEAEKRINDVYQF